MTKHHVKTPEWPVLTEYDQRHLDRIALPLGGIGTGTVSLGGRGDLRDWELVNRPAKGFKPHNAFFALWMQLAGAEPVTRAVEGRISPHDYEGAFGCTIPDHGLPRFRNCHFRAAYPFGQVCLTDPDVPLDVRIEAFNPLIPADTQRSAIPAAILRFVFTNKTSEPVSASICGNIGNFIGTDGTNGKPDRNFNTVMSENVAIQNGTLLQGIKMQSRGVNPCAEQWGTVTLSVIGKGAATYRTGWANLSWGDSLLDFWDDFSSDGKLEERPAAERDDPTASLAMGFRVPAQATRHVTFLLTWHFPNRLVWSPKPELSTGCCAGDNCMKDPNRVGNEYTTRFKDAWDVALQTASHLPQLEADTLAFVNAFVSSNLPGVVKEAALYNLSTLRSQTAFRAEDGRLYGWEGCGDKAGCCHGSCTHVWNYEQATPFLFGELACSMREVEFIGATHDDGLMLFRAPLPFGSSTDWLGAAADGQMGCLMKLYRDWQLSGDDRLLARLWPHARTALEFCWIPGGWDSDRDGVMEGCQHNTMDVEYYGPNPQMGIWYLGALFTAARMADHLGEHDFAIYCERLYQSGRHWIDEHLFNGEYYEHEVRPPSVESSIAAGLRVGMGPTNLAEPELQLGTGCLVDQLVGQYMAHVCNLGYLVDAKHVQTTLRSIMKYNYKSDFSSHFNHLRSFVLNDESALVMATYPHGRRPRRPFPYYNEVMTGFEYAAAVHMLYEGQTSAGLKVIGSIRDRYDGLKRNPFDEAECGHHYARAMASWGAVLALTGFHYSGVHQSMAFKAQAGNYFWSNGYAWGICDQMQRGNEMKVKLKVLGGVLRFQHFSLTGMTGISFKSAKVLKAGESVTMICRS